MRGGVMAKNVMIKLTFNGDNDPDLRDWEEFLEVTPGRSIKDKLLKLIRVNQGGMVSDDKFSVQKCKDVAMMNMLCDYFEDDQPHKAKLLRILIPIIVNQLSPSQGKAMDGPLNETIDKLLMNKKKS